MKTIIKNTLVLTLVLALFSSCSKFEDGPKISLRSIKKRIYGRYTIKYFSKNGEDLTSYWNQYYSMSFKFGEHEDVRPVDNRVYVRVQGSIDSCGIWKYYGVSYGTTIHDRGDSVLLSLYNYINDTLDYPGRLLYPLIIHVSENYVRLKITRLTNVEMWLELEENGDYYEIHLKE